MANNRSFFFFFISFLLFLSDCSKKVEIAYGFEAKSVNLDHPMHVFAISSLTPANLCSTPTKAAPHVGSSKASFCGNCYAFSFRLSVILVQPVSVRYLQPGSKDLSKLQVAYTYGPCSPLKQRNTTRPSFHQILLQDQTRITYIRSKISNKNSVSSSAVEIPANSGSSLGARAFVVTIGLGTPAQHFTVIFDTGSDLLWVQCLPCSGGCYTQADPYFNPSSSSTYSNIPCGSNACSQVKSDTGNEVTCTTNCIYASSYGDGSYSEGYFATDTLTLSSSNVFPNFEFGCGEAYGGSFGSVDGLLGLGRNQISTVSQTAQTYGKLFSYCLPSTSSSTGYLAFGEAVSSSGVQYTSLLTNAIKGPSFYFLSLTGISVGGELLSIPSSVFTTAGTIIDSGTTITYLAPTAYSSLRSAFRQAMSNYRSTPPYSILDTCYDFSGYDSVTLPAIVLHFSGGTDLNVDDQSGILVSVSSTQYCLAFAGNSADTDLEIIGNTQQQTIEMIYDVAGGRLGIVPKSCS